MKPLPSSAFKVFNIAFAELTSNSGTLSALRSPSNASNCGVSGTEGECKWPTHPHGREGEWPWKQKAPDRSGAFSLLNSVIVAA